MDTILYLDHTAKMGGGEIALLNLVRSLDRSRFRPIVVLASDGPLAEKLKNAGIEVVLLPLDSSVVDTRIHTLGAGSLVKFRQIASVVTYARRIARLAGEIDASVIHTNSLKSDIYGGIAGRMAGIPVVWHVRDSITSDYLPAAVAAAFRMLARFVPTAVVANSHSTLGTLRLPASRKTGVVYSGVDLSTFSTIEPHRRDSAAPIVAMVGRIARWKGQHVFIEAASAVLQRRPDCRFQIIGAPLFGEDGYLAHLRGLAAKLGVADNVEFLGFRADVPDLIAAADVVVHASIKAEPFGQVVVEAMAAGKPVIATNGGGLREIVVDGETGFLVPMGDVEEMAKRILELLGDPALALSMGRAGRKRVEEKFTIRQSLDIVQTLYSHLLNSGRATGIPEAVPSAP